MSSGFPRDGGVSATEFNSKRHVLADCMCLEADIFSSIAKVEEAFSIEGKDFSRFDYVFDLTGETRYDRPEIVSTFPDP
jgi:hypothetical protein